MNSFQESFYLPWALQTLFGYKKQEFTANQFKQKMEVLGRRQGYLTRSKVRKYIGLR
jgi:hypothetical protein